MVSPRPEVLGHQEDTDASLRDQRPGVGGGREEKREGEREFMDSFSLSFCLLEPAIDSVSASLSLSLSLCLSVSLCLSFSLPSKDISFFNPFIQIPVSSKEISRNCVLPTTPNLVKLTITLIQSPQMVL